MLVDFVNFPSKIFETLNSLKSGRGVQILDFLHKTQCTIINEEIIKEYSNSFIDTANNYVNISNYSFHKVSDIIRNYTISLHERKGENDTVNEFRKRETIINLTDLLLHSLDNITITANLSSKHKVVVTNGIEIITNKILNALSTPNSAYLVQECTLETFQNSHKIMYKDIELINDQQSADVPWLETVRGPFLDKIIEQIDKYFPENQLANFKVFLPSQIPKNVGSSRDYGRQEIRSICEFLQWDNCEQLLIDWASLIESIIESDLLCELTQTKTKSFMFWSIIIKSENIAWTPLTKKLIYMIMVIPVGSAEAERGFSIMNHIRGDGRRSRLTSKHLEDIVRIRTNGPDKIEEFSAVKYAKIWTNQNHMLSDDPTFINRPLKRDKNKEKLPDFPLY